MKILLTGSTGLIGSELKDYLNRNAIDVYCLIRNKDLEDDKSIYWNPENNILDVDLIRDVDCVIHLAGENISAKRWSKKQKKKILNSRIKSTNYLIESLIKLDKKPKTFICASAVGYYGDRGDKILNEQEEKGEGFLSDVCYEWERCTLRAKESGMRVVNLRFGVILSEKGGALKKMLMPFKLGFGGKIGFGKQYISWITLQDAVRAIEFCIKNEQVIGPVNIVSPNPVTNKQLTKSIGKQLIRPTIFPLPALVAKIILGEMANELLLASTRVEPSILLENGFDYKFKTFDNALTSLI